MRTGSIILIMALIGNGNVVAASRNERLQIQVVGEDAKDLPCRIHLYDQAGKPQRAAQLPFFRDHFVCPGQVELQLPAGSYRIEIERVPEYEQYADVVHLADGESKRSKWSKRTNESKKRSVCLKRIADLAEEGWYSGDLHVHRAIDDIPLLMRAEDLHVAPVITWWNNRNLWADRAIPKDLLIRFDKDRCYQVMAGEDEREGGAVMFFNRQRPLPLAGSTREYPSPMRFITQARREGAVWIDIEKPFWWDVPVWLASGQVDSIGLANNHMCRSQMYETEAWGKPRDAKRLPPPRGNGFWTQEIYYHILNCGLRVPPSAGSASGVLPNPLGYDRVYVHCGDQFDDAAWWRGLKQGHSFVTNGPLLLVHANGHVPGHVFAASNDEPMTIDLKATLISRDRVPAIQIIKNGQVERSVPVTGTSSSMDLGAITFRKSGWFLVRAITDLKHTFRFASSAPYYVEIGSEPRLISRQSAQFFVDWITQRMDRIPLKLKDPGKLQEVLSHHRRAKQYWKQLAIQATGE